MTAQAFRLNQAEAFRLKPENDIEKQSKITTCFGKTDVLLSG
jgi:hypothetical protein